jgi:hypothetical protein
MWLRANKSYTRRSYEHYLRGDEGEDSKQCENTNTTSGEMFYTDQLAVKELKKRCITRGQII